MGAELIKEWIREETFFAYDGNIVKKFRHKLGGGRKCILLSPYDLKDSAIAHEDTAGEFNIVGSARESFKIYPMNVQCSPFSSVGVDEDYYDRKVNVFILAPYPDPTSKRWKLEHPESNKIVSTKLHSKDANINVIAFPEIYHEQLRRFASKMTVMTEIHAELENEKQRSSDLADEVKALNKQIMSKHTENQQLTNMTKIHAFIRGGTTFVPVASNNILAIAIVGVVMGWASFYASTIKLFAPYEGIEMGLLIGALIMMVVIVKSQENKVPAPTTKEMGTH